MQFNFVDGDVQKVDKKAEFELLLSSEKEHAYILYTRTKCEKNE